LKKNIPAIYQLADGRLIKLPVFKKKVEVKLNFKKFKTDIKFIFIFSTAQVPVLYR